jgi:hypothetical protein
MRQQGVITTLLLAGQQFVRPWLAALSPSRPSPQCQAVWCSSPGRRGGTPYYCLLMWLALSSPSTLPKLPVAVLPAWLACEYCTRIHRHINIYTDVNTHMSLTHLHLPLPAPRG